MIVPEIVDMNLPMEGVFHNCAIVSIKKSYPMQAQKVMHALWGMGQMMNTKIIIIMDADVDVQDLIHDMKNAGYSLLETKEYLLPAQSFSVFKKK